MINSITYLLFYQKQYQKRKQKQNKVQKQNKKRKHYQLQKQNQETLAYASAYIKNFIENEVILNG